MIGWILLKRHTDTDADIWIHTYGWTYRNRDGHTETHIQRATDKHSQKRPHIYTHTYMQIDTHSQTQTHMHSYTDSNVLVGFLLLHKEENGYFDSKFKDTVQHGREDLTAGAGVAQHIASIVRKREIKVGAFLLLMQARTQTYGMIPPNLGCVFLPQLA